MLFSFRSREENESGGKERRFARRLKPRGNPKQPPTHSEATTPHVHDQDESVEGVEVSLSFRANGETDRLGGSRARAGDVSAAKQSTKHPVTVPTASRTNSAITPQESSMLDPLPVIQAQLEQKRRVRRAQFSTRVPSGDASTSDNAVPPLAWRPQGHRVPLMGYTVAEPAYDTALRMLRGAAVTTERAAVQEEVHFLEAEIRALDSDRKWLQRHGMTGHTNGTPSGLPVGKQHVQPCQGDHNLNTALRLESSRTLSSGELDINRLLAMSDLPAEQDRLRRQRGTCLTISLENSKAQDALVKKCSFFATTRRGHWHRHRERQWPEKLITLTPKNCRSHGAALQIQHVCLLQDDETASTHVKGGGFFLVEDDHKQKSSMSGHLPLKLYRRLKDERHEVSDIQYLSTGPGGTYFCSFKSGELWWGSAVADPDLEHVMEHWEIHRVVFGPIDDYTRTTDGSAQLVNSWIVIARDGSVAWKNIPARLHSAWEGRLATSAAPVEVSLGPGDSYFCRYLDGIVDYSLPVGLARVCEEIESNGGMLTNVILHPEGHQDFIVRHTEVAMLAD